MPMSWPMAVESKSTRAGTAGRSRDRAPPRRAVRSSESWRVPVATRKRGSVHILGILIYNQYTKDTLLSGLGWLGVGLLIMAKPH